MSDSPAAVPNPSRGPAAPFGALRQRDYRRYFVTSMLAMMADNIEHVISYWLIFQVFHSPALAGFAVISHWLPFLFLSLYAGALADRLDCRKLLQASQALYMLASLAWGALFLVGRLEVWHAVVLLLVHGLAGALAAPAGQLIIHDMVGAEHLHSAIRLNATGRYLAILLGPAVGGGLMLLLGPGWGLVANVLTYAPLTVFLLRIPHTGHVADGGPARRAIGMGVPELGRILREARGDRRILLMILLGGVTSLFVGNAFQAQMPEYAHHFGADDTGLQYSALLAANAAGAVAGALLLEGLGRLQPTPRAAIVCAAAWAVTIGLFPLAPTYGTALVLLLVAGVLNIAFTVMAQTLVQLLAPVARRGGLVGLFNTATLGLRAGSGLTVGVGGELVGVDWSLGLSAAAVLLVTLALLGAETVSRRAASWR